MDTEARKALGVAPIDHGPSNGQGITITKYTPPTSVLHLTVGIACLAGLLAFTTIPYVVPGKPAYELLQKIHPKGAETFVWLARTIPAPLLGIHLLEASLLDLTRLSKYGVKRGSKLWWTWMGSAVIEGFSTFQRIDGMVKKEEKQRKAQ